MTIRNVTTRPVAGDDLYGRGPEVAALWRAFEGGAHVLMPAPRRVGKTSLMRSLWLEPRPGWDVLYADLEHGADAGDCLATVLACFATHPRYHAWVAALPFKWGLGGLLRQAAKGVPPDALQPRLRSQIGRDWEHPAERLHGGLRRLPAADRRLLAVLDELSLVLARLGHRADGPAEAELFGAWLTALRQDRTLAGRVHFLYGGSSPPAEVLRRFGLAAGTAPPALLPLAAWPPSAGADFLVRLGADNGFPLRPEQAAAVVERLGDPVPHHLQAFFAVLKATCEGDAAYISDATLAAAYERLAGPPGPAEFAGYAGRLGVMLAGDGLAAARYVLARLAQTAEGVPRSRLVPAAGYGGRSPLPAALRLLEEEGYVAADGETVRFRSRLLRDWWRRNQLADR